MCCYLAACCRPARNKRRSSPREGSVLHHSDSQSHAAGLHATSSVCSLGQGLALLVRIDHLLTTKLHWATAFQAFST